MRDLLMSSILKTITGPSSTPVFTAQSLRRGFTYRPFSIDLITVASPASPILPGFLAPLVGRARINGRDSIYLGNHCVQFPGPCDLLEILTFPAIADNTHLSIGLDFWWFQVHLHQSVDDDFPGQNGSCRIQTRGISAITAVVNGGKVWANGHQVPWSVRLAGIVTTENSGGFKIMLLPSGQSAAAFDYNAPVGGTRPIAEGEPFDLELSGVSSIELQPVTAGQTLTWTGIAQGQVD